jgi:uncharacterized membrane protein
MFTPIVKFHRFLAHQSAYPLLFSSLLAAFFLAGRVLYTRSWDYRTLAWNLFLAWIPYGCAFLAVALYRLSPKLWWLMLPLGALWLIFFPNAPYIVTDFYHLIERPPVPLWYDIGLIAIFAFSGCFLAIASLRSMQFLVERYLGKIIGWLFVMISIGLCGLGIYLGRFGRYNSWDVFFQPYQVMKDLAIRMLNPLDNPRFIGFTLMFTAILLVFYLMFASMSRMDQTDRSS